MDLGLKDRVVIVTGAASGIGKAIAEAYAAEGAKLALADINFEGLTKLQKSLKKAEVYIEKVAEMLHGIILIKRRTDLSLMRKF